MWIGQEAERAADLGEAKFFRAWAYRFLVTLWGDVPFITEPISKPKTDLFRTPKAEIYELVVEDLEYAAQYLPVPGTEKGPGRLTKAAALHLLADVYIALERWQDAIDAASSVINDFGFALMQERFGNQYSYKDLGNGGDVYWDLFRYGNQNNSVNTEDIWVIQYEPNTDGGSANWNAGRAWGPQYWRIGSDPDGYPAIIGDNPEATANIYLSAFGRPAAWGRGTNYTNYDIWRSDWDNDIRNASHNIFRDWKYNNPASPWFGKPIDFVNDYPAGARNILQDTTRGLYPYFMKTDAPGIRFIDPNRQGGGATHVDQYLMRLAETFLIRAEAYLGAGNKDLAAADINQIRNRAKATPVASGDVSIEYILDERARELYTEDFRLIILYRLGLVVERTRKFNNNPIFPGNNIQDYHNLFPIPQSEIDLNVDGVLEQNPGYN
jgi:hypothetical protein